MIVNNIFVKKKLYNICIYGYKKNNKKTSVNLCEYLCVFIIMAEVDLCHYDRRCVVRWSFDINVFSRELKINCSRGYNVVMWVI